MTCKDFVNLMENDPRSLDEMTDAEVLAILFHIPSCGSCLRRTVAFAATKAATASAEEMESIRRKGKERASKLSAARLRDSELS